MSRTGEPAPPSRGGDSAAEHAEGSEQRWRRRGLSLVGGTIAYNSIEALLAVVAALRSGSIALLGFGLDSVIELTAGIVVLRRVRLSAGRAEAEALARSELGARRFIAWTFFLLALYVTVQAILILWQRAAPEESVLGIALASASLVIMPLLAAGKLRAARALGSDALRAEAKETLACAYLSATLLLGLLCNALLGWWWADPVAALLMVPWLVHEGAEQLESTA